jgi:hypothetical protein
MKETAMTKPTQDPREQQRENQQAQQDADNNRQSAESHEVDGRHRQDGQKDHKGADKGPRGQ